MHRLKNSEVLVNPLKDTLMQDYPEIFESVKQHLAPWRIMWARSFRKMKCLLDGTVFCLCDGKRKGRDRKEQKSKSGSRT